MNRTFLAISSVAFLLLSGCITTPKLETYNLETWDSVAFISLSGNKFRGSKVGTTAFNNSYDDWIDNDIHLDPIIEAAFSEVSSERTNWNLNSKDKALLDLRQSLPEDFNAYSDFEVSEELKAKLKSLGFNALIIYLPNWSRDDLANTNQGYSGVGVFNRSFIGIDNSWYVVVGKLMTYPLDSPESKPSWHPIKITREMYGEFEYQENWNMYSLEQKEEIRKALYKILSNALPMQFEEFYDDVDKAIKKRNTPIGS